MVTPELPKQADAGVDADSPVVEDGGSADDKIRERAYLIWVDEGRPHARELDHWLRAKWEIESPPRH